MVSLIDLTMKDLLTTILLEFNKRFKIRLQISEIERAELLVWHIWPTA